MGSSTIALEKSQGDAGFFFHASGGAQVGVLAFVLVFAEGFAPLPNPHFCWVDCTVEPGETTVIAMLPVPEFGAIFEQFQKSAMGFVVGQRSFILFSKPATSSSNLLADAMASCNRSYRSSVSSG